MSMCKISRQSKRITPHCCEENLQFIPTEYQLANIFTKPLDEPTFTRLKAELEFWCTVVVERPRPTIEDFDPIPLKESSIRFTVKNGKTQLYLEFKTFCQSTRLDYNNGSYAIMPQTEAVKAELLKLGLHNDRNEIETPNVLVNKTPLLTTVHPDKGTFTSQLLPEGTPTNPKDLGRNIQLTDMGLPSTMVTDLSGVLTLLNIKKIFEAGYEMEIDLPYATKEHSQPPLFTDKVTPSDEHHSLLILNLNRKQHNLKNLYPMNTNHLHLKYHNPNHPRSTRNHLNHMTQNHHQRHRTSKIMITTCQLLRGFWQRILKGSPRAHENTNTSLRKYGKILLDFKSQHIEGLNKIITNLKSVQDAVKEDPALNVKVLEATEAYVKNSSNLIKLNTDMKEIIEGLRTTLEAIQNTFNAQNDHLATWAESSKSMAWNVGPRLTRIETTQATIQYDLALLKTNTDDIKAYGTPIHTAIPITTPIITEVITPITTITPTEATLVTKVSGSSLIIPRADKGKGIATKTDPSPPKLVKASRRVRLDPGAPVLIEYMIDGKMVQITHDQLQAYLDKK
ncbi:hypothetical protein Tco_0576583 [Tanacetum coccineum]